MSDEALRMFERARSMGDLAAHNALKAYRERAGLLPEVPEPLKGYDWDEAFAVAGDGLAAAWSSTEAWDYNQSKHNKPDIRPGLDPSFNDLTPFDRRDIKRLIAYAEGDHAGPDWIALMELWDGRYAYLSAGWDYTGWD